MVYPEEKLRSRRFGPCSGRKLPKETVAISVNNCSYDEKSQASKNEKLPDEYNDTDAPRYKVLSA